ncbi:MAG: DUF3750 domain-containing protein [Candidatus Paceibacterota bacterium]
MEYFVRIYSSPVPIPFTFAVHTYLVVGCDDVRDRYDVLPFLSNDHPKNYDGYVCKNILPPETGFRCFGRYPFVFGPRYRTTVIGEETGGPQSVACRLYERIEAGLLHEYPYKERYNMVLGPNSNTFTQWMLDQTPDLEITLPWNAWGKRY